MRKLLILLFLLLSSIFSIAGTFEISMENDVMAKTDRHYTHGTRLTYFGDTDISMHLNDETTIMGWSLGQYMYTPSNITVEDIQVGDRPYAGWLYLSGIMEMYDDKDFILIELSLGLTGEWSLAGETQKMIHEWIGSKKPMGWDTQLHERIGFNLTMIRRHKWRIKDYADFIAEYNLALGSIHVNTGLGCQFRVGYNVPDDFGIIRMEPTSREFAEFGAYGILGLSGRVVGYSYFLEGNNTERIYDIHPERLVGDLGIGFGIHYGDCKLTYLYNARSKEFKEQKDHNEFGTIAISWGF